MSYALPKSLETLLYMLEKTHCALAKGNNICYSYIMVVRALSKLTIYEAQSR